MFLPLHPTTSKRVRILAPQPETEITPPALEGEVLTTGPPGSPWFGGIFGFFFKYKFIYFNWRLITLQYCIGFAIHQHESATGVHPEPPSILPPHTIPLGHPSAPAPSNQYPALNLDWRFISCMILHVSMPFSQIIPPSPSPTESKRPFYTSVSLLLSRIQGYHYHLSKFHIYA